MRDPFCFTWAVSKLTLKSPLGRGALAPQIGERGIPAEFEISWLSVECAAGQLQAPG